MTQTEVATKIGANRAQYSNWENGVANVPSIFLDRLLALGFGDIVPKDDAPKVRATAGQLRVLIDVVSDCDIREEIRNTAKLELQKALGID